jgi:xanthine dehydrogenase accessory factor
MNRNEWITQAARLQSADQPFALVTVLSAQAPTSGKAGDKAVVTPDGQIHGWIGGGCAQPAVIKTVRRALLDGQPRKIRIAPSDESAERDLGDVLEFGMACHSGGTLELFIDPVMPSATLTVVGDSPVARALVGLAPRVGLRVALVAHGAQAADFPDADTVLATDDVNAVNTQLASTPFVVVATQGRRDVQGLKAALALQPQGLWFVASASKAGVLLDSLVASGEDPAAVARIVAPAGEFIGAQTPEEIALSVLTSVVAARRGREPLVPAAQAALTASMASSSASATQSSGAASSAGSSSCCSTTASTEPKEAASAQALAPVAASTCCGGAKKAVAATTATASDISAVSARTAEPQAALATVAASAKSSCCGG